MGHGYNGTWVYRKMGFEVGRSVLITDLVAFVFLSGRIVCTTWSRGNKLTKHVLPQVNKHT